MAERLVLYDNFKIRRRTLKSGATRDKVTIEIETEPLLFELDEMVLGQPAADAVKEIIQSQINGISKRVSDATLERRKRAHKDAGRSRWYKKRYSGGRTGDTPPGPNSTQWGVDSGRMANNLTVRDNPTDASYTVNVVANRLKQETFGKGFLAFVQELSRLVPAIGNPRSMIGDKRFERGVNEAVNLMITKGKDRADAERILRLKMLRAQRVKAIAAGFRFVSKAAGR